MPPNDAFDPPRSRPRPQRPGLRDWLDAAAAAPRLLAIRLLLPLTGIQRLRRWTAPSPAAGRNAPSPDRIARRVVALRRVGARIPGCRCLARSMALSWWLGRYGLVHEVYIGVQGSSNELAAHSWVEIDGRPIDDEPETIARLQRIHRI